MEIQELRIGNLIQNGSDFYKIVCVDSTQNVLLIETDSNGFAEINIDEAVPIKLDENILLNKCGFKNKKDYITLNDVISFHVKNGEIEKTFINGDSQLDYNIEYLHDLQNMFYDLKKRAMEVTL